MGPCGGWERWGSPHCPRRLGAAASPPAAAGSSRGPHRLCLLGAAGGSPPPAAARSSRGRGGPLSMSAGSCRQPGAVAPPPVSTGSCGPGAHICWELRGEPCHPHPPGAAGDPAACSHGELRGLPPAAGCGGTPQLPAGRAEFTEVAGSHRFRDLRENFLALIIINRWPSILL